MVGRKRKNSSNRGGRAKKGRVANGQNLPSTTEADKPLISLELINGKIPPVEPTATSLRYIPIVKGPADLDKKYDLIRIIVVNPGQPKDLLKCSIKIRVLPFLDAVGNHRKTLIDGLEENDIPMDDYVALSYVWEDQERTEPIHIHHPDGPLKYWITYNMKCALTALRHPTSPRNFWADAISMDQDNDDEKSQQLPLMARIYSEAIRVCVWLSEKKEDTLQGSNLAKKIFTADAFSLIRKLRQWQRFRTVVKDDTTCEEWLAFMWMITRPWFQRRWVVQEIVLAAQAELRCGSESIDWMEFAQALSLFEAMEDDVKDLFRNNPRHDNAHDKFGAFREFSANRLVQVTANIVSRREDGRVAQKNESLESLVSTLAPFKAGDPKDIIYAILSLANDVSATATDVKLINELTISDLTADQQKRKDVNELLRVLNRIMRNLKNERFPVDYKKEFDEICHDLYVFTTLHSGSLDLICRPWCPKDLNGKVSKCSRKLPTWVRPLDDFAWRLDEDGNMERVNADILVGLPGKSPYHASGKLRAEYSFERDGGPRGTQILSAKGFQLDIISTVEVPAIGGMLPAVWLKYKSSASQQALQAQQTRATKSPAAESKISAQFWRTMVAGKGPNGQNPPLSYPLVCQELFNDKYAINLPQKAKETKNMVLKDFITRVLSVICERKLCRTAKHERLALLPGEAAPGDVICILFGCSVPVVLRETPDTTTDGKSIWELVGECYVYDMMMGEALIARRVGSERDPDFYQNQVFKIR